MKFKSIKTAFAAIAAAVTLGAALPAAADHYDRGHGSRTRDAITIRMNSGQFTVDPSDRVFYNLLRAPYNFRPGLTYVYTDRCNRWGCDVLVFNGRGGRPVDRIFAARPGYGADWRAAGRYVERDYDRRYRWYN